MPQLAPYFPENHAALHAMLQDEQPLIDAALLLLRRGFSVGEAHVDGHSFSDARTRTALDRLDAIRSVILRGMVADCDCPSCSARKDVLAAIAPFTELVIVDARPRAPLASLREPS